MTRHAFGIQFEAGSNNELLVGRCLKILHGFQCRHSINSIGVTFPENSHETIGAIIAFVSLDQSFLLQLMAQEYYQQMQRLQKFLIHDIVAVPDNVLEVRYSRDSKRDKQCAGGRQRSIRRGQRIAENAGYQYQPRRNTVVSERQNHFFYNIPITSSSNCSQVYYLRIQRHIAEDFVCNSYTSYGLGNKTDKRGSVPDRLPFKK
ncbi:type I-F CRISPR-associated endoribonuclease Cas6/Csy4 [Endozoicomonas gorgoniicola]|uniref:Type I-F CRISPR-associated endoribonuclease Cas6/Csy4 n=1 Tax=Endozoicomonas gorgoniicola TaxID=1234144 RepID=A0ABT3N3Y6_9GAMM|nr:type I-F CRISPR-associated endoribonuclease Cas6/Csy4 [Endozoicomonas gorgoniicola]MCW7555914.1 type I-F CRISPR-associated endoribonuclease Cas6/Csy4 [Endozoicomonas gorgoniicola]